MFFFDALPRARCDSHWGRTLKNRYHDPTINKRFVVGIDRGKMKLYDCEQSAQDDILDSGQEEEYNKQEDKLSKFAGLKF